MRGTGMNYCTVSVHLLPETESGRTLRLSYDCHKGGYLVRGCRYFKPMTCAGGLKCHGECEYFNEGCTHKRARAAARKRANELLGCDVL